MEEDEAVKILDVVKSGGFKYFDMFYAVLIETGNGSVADLLRPELAITRPDTTIETELPDGNKLTDYLKLYTRS